MEHLARGSWEVANDPARRRRNPSVREQIRSPYYWFSVLTFGAAVLIWLVANPGWLHALAAVLYVVALIASALAHRDARAISLTSRTTEEK
jgi:Flp pilus assembly protein TadB